MKKLNLIERLWTDSHEKQSPQRFARYAAILIMLLTLGVGQMWAKQMCDLKSSGDVNRAMPNYEAGYNMGTIYVWFSINGASYASKGSTSSNIGTDRAINASNITSGLKLNKFSVPVYCHNQWHGDACNKNGARIVDKSLVMSWKVSNPSGTAVGSGDFSVTTSPSMSWGGNGATATWTSNTSEKNLLTGVSASTSGNLTYTMDFWYKFKCHMYNSSGSDWGSDVNVWYPGGEDHFKYQFTIPQTTLTVNTSGDDGSATASSGISTAITYNTDYSLTASNVTGYDFVNWTTSDANITITSPTSRTGAKVKFTAFTNATITANYTPKTTTVTLNGNAPGGQTVTGGGTEVIATYDASLPSFSALTCTGGYALKGYYTTTSGGTKVINADGTFAANSGIWNRTDGATLTLHAQWSLDRTLTYDANGGTGTMTDTNSPYANGATVTVKSNSFTRTGYTFTGWNTVANGSGTPYSAGNTFSITANTTLYAQWSENMTTVTLVANPSGAGTFTVGSTPNQTSTTAGVTTTRSITAVPEVGYFVKTSATVWSKNNGNITLSSTTANPVTVTGGGSGGTSTLTGTFTRTYAFIEGRMTIWSSSAKSSEIHVGSSKGKWSEDSRNIAMDYDATNHRFYRHTYKTPAELSATQTDGSAQSQWFSIARSDASGTWTNKTTYHPSSNTDLTTAGVGQKKSAQTSTTTNNYKFNSSVTNGYVILYFDEAGVWYEIEHSLTYNANGGSGSAPSTTYHLSGTNATAAGKNTLSKSNYTFDGWNTDQYITGTNYAVDASVPMSANTTLYAKWTRSVTLNQNGATTDGSISVTATYNCAALPSIIAPEKTGYIFGGWSTSAGGSTIVIDASGKLVASKSGWTDASKRFTRTESGATLYAVWTAKTYTASNNIDKNGGDSDGKYTATYDAKSITINTVPAKTGYTVEGYYLESGCTNKVSTTAGALQASKGSLTDESSKWIYDDTDAKLYTKWTANTYTIAFNANDAQYVGTATGSTASVGATYDQNVTLTSNGFSRAGYTFAGWARTAAGAVEFSNGQTLTKPNLTSTQGETVTLYAKWTGKTYTVTFNPRGGSGLSKTSQEVTMGSAYGALATVTPPAGYVFDGWYTSSAGGTKVTAETLVATPSDHTLYAHYVQKAQVYFKNTLGWSKVYVTYDAYWDSSNPSKGSGNSGKTTHLMTLVAGTTDVYYDDIPDAILSNWKGSIVFYNEQQDNYANFNKGQAVFRRDFDSDATMFVPVPNDPNKFTLNAGTTYYSTDQVVDKSGDDVTNYRYKNGYWVRYNNVEAGYTVKGSWAWDDDHYVERHSLNDSTYVFTIRNLAANTDYYFNLYKHCTTSNSYSSVFKPAADMTSASSDVVFSAQYAGGSDKKMKTTVAGDYTFKFVFSRLGEIRLTIEYPLAVNDYRVVYSYTKGGAQTFASEYIKAKADAVDTISMFIHSADSATARSLYIQKCTGMTAGVPTWDDDYSAIALPTETASGKTSGVYNFKISQNGSKEATGEPIGKYNGNFYIRTDSAAGGWDFYKEYPSSQMTYSEYSLSQTLSAPYSHYYCQYVGNSSTDISYTIATDYSPAICPIQEGDATIGVGNKTLPSGKPASVRFTWNEETNATFRSYLKSAQGDGNKRFLVLHGSDNKVLDADGNTIAGEGEGAEQMHANELLFSDTENWVYELAFKAKPGAKVSIIARYNDVDRYLVGKADAWETIISGGADTKYDIAAVYDFKTNRLITTWIPSGTISDQIEEVDVLIERHNQDGATTITFGKASEEAKAGSISAKRVIGALRFEYNELVGRVASWTEDTRAKMMFFISFPFDVNVSDIFGLNTNYGEAFIVQGYNGAKRAEKGFFKGDGTDTFWETLPVDTVMHAGVGYVVTLDNDYFNGDVGHIWDNKREGDHVYMYFPSANDPSKPITINSDDKTIKVPAHLCTINRTFNGGKLNHKYTDSNWNVMGVPIFQNHTGDDSKEGTPGALFTADEIPSETTEYADPKNPAFGYFYEWHTDKTYTIAKADGFTFKPMHSYMVQYAGNVKFTCAEPTVPVALAPRRTAMKEDYNIELQVLNNNGDMLNHTYVELRENACDTFALNEDIYMMSNNKAASVYTFAGTYDVAANVLSIGSHVVPVGVIVKQAGTYTFTMPSNFSGTVTLIDTYADTRTNLALGDYEVNLPKGTFEDRFLLEININKMPTAIDGVEDGQGTLKDGKAHKYIENGQMYILQNGLIYDAQGKRVK